MKTVLFLIAAFITYACSQMLEWDEQGNLIAHHFSIWADWSAHFTFISQFRNQSLNWIWGDNPLFSGFPFQYPFLSHALTAAFAAVCALDIPHATYISSLMLMALLPFALCYAFRSLPLKPFTACMGMLIFLFMGGLQFLDSALDPMQPLSNQPISLQEPGPFFTHFLSFEFFPQRAFLFALPLLCFVGGSIVRRSNQNNTKNHLWVGMLFFPLFLFLHVHTWIALSFLLLCFGVFPPLPFTRKNIILFGCGVALLSLFFLKLFLLRSSPPPELKYTWNYFRLGWGPKDMNEFWFWLYETGIFLPLAAMGFFLNRKNPILKPFFAAGVGIFILTLFVQFQPSSYDNLKLMTYAFLFLTPFVALSLEALWNKKLKFNLQRVAVFLILLSLTATGISDTLFFAQQKQTALLFSKSEMDLAEEWKTIRHSPTDLVVINPNHHHHWLPCLTGSPLWMGYPGWLWSWGIQYRAREEEVFQVLLGFPQAPDLIKKHHLRYAVFRAQDQIANRPVNLAFFQAHYELLFSRDSWYAFDLSHERLIATHQK